jgi:hypothetical protein
LLETGDELLLKLAVERECRYHLKLTPGKVTGISIVAVFIMYDLLVKLFLRPGKAN